MKESLKPCAYKLWDRRRAGPRTFCRTVRRAALAGKVKRLKARSRRETEPEEGQSPPAHARNRVIYPCPG